MKTKRTINLMAVKIVDKYPVESKFDFDDELLVVLRGEIVKREVFNNNDGTVNLILTFKALKYDIKRENS